MNQQFLEFFILIAILVTVAITIFRLYSSNERLKVALNKLNNLYTSTKESLNSLTLKNEILEEKSKEIDRLKEVEKKYNQLLGQYKKLEEELHKSHAQNALYNSQIQEYQLLEEKIKYLQSALNEKEELVESLKEQMKSEFKNLSNELLEKKQLKLQEDNKEQLKQILEPFDRELKEFKDTISKINSEQSSTINILRGELNQLKELNNNLSKDAKELAAALKGDNKLQGNWGELILERALESSGLRRDIEYKREVELFDGNVKYRVDVLINLPDNKHLVIDSKVSLKSYLRALKAPTLEEQKEAKKELVSSIKRHIDILSSKKYHMLDNILTPEFTIMFIPIESAFTLALEQDSSLLEYALNKGVSIVTPTTLIATLKSIATIWKLANHDKNMQLLAKEASSLHYKFAIFLEEFNKIEQRLNQAQESWQSAKLKLINGQGNLYSKIQRVGELSGKAKRELPKLTKEESI